MNPRNFNDDLNKYDKNLNIRKSWEEHLKREFGSDVEIMWKDDKTSQLDFGSDILIKTKKGRKYAIDLKCRNPKYKNLKQWTIEIVHQYYNNSNKEIHLGKKEGWLYCSVADYIFYGTVSEDYNKIIEYIGFSLTPFKDEEFKQKLNPLFYSWSSTQYDTKFQLTLCKIMDYNFLKENANKFWYWREE